MYALIVCHACYMSFQLNTPSLEYCNAIILWNPSTVDKYSPQNPVFGTAVQSDLCSGPKIECIAGQSRKKHLVSLAQGNIISTYATAAT